MQPFHVPLLKRSMHTFGALLITLSSITPASSVFIIAPGAIQQAGSGAFLSFVIAALIGIFTAFIYGEMASAFPVAGGEYAIVGRVLGSFWGTVTLGTNLITAILVLAVFSVGISFYIKPIFPDASPVMTGVVTLGITTLCGLLNLRTNAVVTGIFLCLELLALAILAWLGFSHTERTLTEIIVAPVRLDSEGILQPASFGLIGLASAVAISAYNGYGQAVYLGEEIHNAPQRIARTIMLALLITVVAEAVPVTAVLLGAPDMKPFLSSPNMLGDFILMKGGARLNDIVSLCIALAILNANIAYIIMVARVLFSTGRDRIWTPSINHALTRIYQRFHSPWVATLVCGALGMGACFIDQNLLLVTTGMGLVVVYSMLSICVIIGRHKGLTSHGPYKMPLYPLAPVVALGMMGYIIYANLLDPNIGQPSLIATLGMMIISALYYALILRRRKGWSLKMPDMDKPV